MRSGSLRRLVAILLAMTVAIAGCRGTSRSRSEAAEASISGSAPEDTVLLPPPRWPGFPLLPDGRFPISAWCAPPVRETNDARYAEYAGAGFTVALFALEDPYEAGSNLKRLEVAGRHGVYVIARDIRAHPTVASEPGWRATVDSVAATYRHHPAFLAYFLADEPPPGAFGLVAALARRLALHDRVHPGYVNIAGDNPGAQSVVQVPYSQYVRAFVDSLRPAFFSADNYVLLRSGEDVESFCSGWDTLRAVAGDIPYWAILLLTEHMVFRQPSEAELDWQANLALAHGARGIVWFTYWTPNPREEFHYRNGPIAYDGSRNPIYDTVTRVNARIQSLGRVLAPMSCTDVRHTGRLPRGGRPLGEDLGVRDLGNSDLTFGFFTGAGGRRHVLVVNRSHRNPAQAWLVAPSGLARWTGAPGRYVPEPSGSSPDAALALRIEPGRAVLFRFGR